MRRMALCIGLLSVLLAWGLAWGQVAAGAVKAAPDTGKKLVDINTATPQQLDDLPGIGKAYTKAIIAGRPYKSIQELRMRKIVPKGTYAKIKNLITALPPKPEAVPAEKPSPAAPGNTKPAAPKGPHKMPS